MSRKQPSANGLRPDEVSRSAVGQPGGGLSKEVAQDVRRLEADRVEHAARWAKPTSLDINPEGSGNTWEDPGAHYSVPSQEAEFQAFKDSLIANPGKQLAKRTWIGTDRDVAFQKHMHDTRRVAAKDAWIASLVDMRKPGQAQWISKIAPKFMERRAATINETAAKYARLEFLEKFGINTEEDLDLVWNILSSGETPDALLDTESGYKPGFFAAGNRSKYASHVDAEWHRMLRKGAQDFASGTAGSGTDATGFFGP